MADLSTVEKRKTEVGKKTRGGDKEAVLQTSVLEKIHAALLQGKRAHTVEMSEDESLYCKTLHLLTNKPEIYVLNVDESSIAQGTGLPHNDPHWKDLPDAIAISAKIEAELADLPDEDAKQYLVDLGLKQSGLDKLIQQSYKLLHLLTFFTSGPMETKAWTIHEGTKAPQAAGVIHTDFEKGFIRSETINWKVLLDAGGEVQAREKGLLRIEGKEYVMQDGDVCHFRFNP